MTRHRSPAIVLRRWPYSESSFVLRALTPAQGVVPLFARGFERPTSGYMGVLDTWCLVEIEYGEREGAELYNLYNATLIDRFGGLETSPDRLAAAGLAAEIAETAAPPGSASGPVFLYLLQSLEQLDAGVELSHFLCATIVEGLGLLGLTPALEDQPGEAALEGPRWFSAASGGLAAGRGTDGRRISSGQIGLLRSLRDDPDGARGAHSKDREAVLTILDEFLRYYLERRPRALEILLRRHPSFKSIH